VPSGAGGPVEEGRVRAPFGRRRCEVVANEATGGYRLLRALDLEGPGPRAGQFYMLAGDGWGGPGGRPYLPRAFSVAEAEAEAEGVRLDFLCEAIGPGTAQLGALAPGDGLYLTGPLGRPFSAPHELLPDAAGAILVGGGDPAPRARRARRPAAGPARVSRPGSLGWAGAVSLLGAADRVRGRPCRPPGLRHRSARGPARRGGRRPLGRRLRLWAAADAGGRADDVRRARRRL